MNMYITGILCTICLIISQGFTATTNLPEDQLNERNIINKYLKLKGIEIDKHPVKNDTNKHDETIMPLWIINPPYYLVEKLFQLLGSLIQYDDDLVIYRP
ncbi:unnamed protein product [Schistosoma spindalis]|nr:unnamed protein product [Schistosoma spindale]